MKLACVAVVILSSLGCASANGPNRTIASADVGGDLVIKNQPVKFTIVDRGWNTRTGSVELSDKTKFQGFPTIEAVKSFLIIHQANTAASYELVKVESALKAAEQCQTFGAKEKANRSNYIDGYTTTVTSKIVNNLEMPADFMLRYVCMVSVLAAGQSAGK